MNQTTRFSRRGLLKGTVAAAVPLAALGNYRNPFGAPGTTAASALRRTSYRSTTTAATAAPATTAAGTQAADIIAMARDAMAKYDMRAVILRVLIDAQEVVTAALGESMTNVPATTDMHFRNGAVAISYMSTLLLELVDQKVVGLDDKLSKWMPELPASDRVTLRMLANMTAGYPDFVRNDGFVAAFYANPFRQWTPQEQIAISLSTPRIFEPGANWDYSHSNYVILGQALEKLAGKPMDLLMQQYIIGPLGLHNTAGFATAEIPEPVLHAFTSERREALGVPPGARFYEESTYWNPSWTLAQGAIQTTNIYDMTASAIAIGTGSLLSPASHQAQVSPSLIGFGSPLEGCPTCRTLDQNLNYGLGVFIGNSWLVQNPSFAGGAAVEGYLPSKKIAIAVAANFGEGSFGPDGGIKNYAQTLFNTLGAYLAPDDPPPGPGVSSEPAPSGQH